MGSGTTLLDQATERLASDDCLERVEQLMHELAGASGRAVAGALAREHLASGGKRLRARLALAAHQALGLPRSHGVGWAAACELVHNATLVHDDLQDRDTRRRGVPTIWATHGDAQAINTGDLMLMLPFLALERVEVPDALRWRLGHTIAERTAAVVEGQTVEQNLARADGVDWPTYEAMVVGKTSALFELPVLGAAFIAGREGAAARTLAAPFRSLGVLFQLQDDILDLFGDKGRGRVGSDIYEGKMSCLVVLHLGLHPGDRDEVLRLLRLPRAEKTEAKVRSLIARFRADGALAQALDHIQDQTRRIESLAAEAGEESLAALSAALVRRALEPIAHVTG